MELTIILATCRPVDLASTLESLSRCDLPENFSHTIVIENGTSKRTLTDVIQKASPKLKITYMHSREGNKSHALNLAIETLQENQLLFLTDDDVQFDKDILLHYANAANGQTTGKVYGGKIKPDGPIPPPTVMTPFIPASMLGFPNPKAKMDLSKVLFIGPNWAVFSDDVKRLGGFNPLFGPGSKLRATGQETEMMRAMRSNGYEFRFVEPAVVWHKVEAEQYTDGFIADRKYRNGVELGIRWQLESRSLKWVDQLKLQFKAKLIPPLLPLMRVSFSRSIFLKNLVRANLSRGKLTGYYANVLDDQTTNLDKFDSAMYSTEQMGKAG